MEEKKTLTTFQKFTAFMEQDTRAVQLISYGITGIGLLFAIYKIRPFSKFKKPSDIPSHFLKHTELQGIVARIDPTSGVLLLVDHKPLIPFPRFGKNKYLPIKLAGITTNNQGISWLQTIVNGKKITFTPLAINKDYLNCIVCILEKDQKHLNIGEELIKLGFGTVCNHENYLLKETFTVPYYKSLIKAQKFAQFKRNGYWHFVKEPTISWRTKVFLSDKLKSLLPTFLTKQLNI